eukprot:gene9257-biopygen35
MCVGAHVAGTAGRCATEERSSEAMQRNDCYLKVVFPFADAPGSLDYRLMVRCSAGRPHPLYGKAHRIGILDKAAMTPT